MVLGVEGLKNGAAAGGEGGIEFIADPLCGRAKDQRFRFPGQEFPEPFVDHLGIPRRTKQLGELPQFRPRVSHGAVVKELLPCCQH
jgi:hypothetical protein